MEICYDIYVPLHTWVKLVIWREYAQGLVVCVTPCEVIQDSLDSGFYAVDSGCYSWRFRIPSQITF